MNKQTRTWFQTLAGAIVRACVLIAAASPGIAAPLPDDDDDFEVLLIEALPQTTVTSPANGSVVDAPANLALVAQARSKKAYITRVEFYQGSTLIGTSNALSSGTSTNGSWQLAWNGVSYGSYTLKARAYNTLNQWGDSPRVSLIVNAKPLVSLTCPAASVAAGQSVSLSANASDADGTIAKVEFYQGATLLGVASSPSAGTTSNGTWAAVWAPALGSYALTAKAYDNRNSLTSSNTCNVSVKTPPSVTITAPSTTAQVALGGSAGVSLSATATAASGATIAQIKLFNNGSLVQTCSNVNTCTFALSAPAGTHNLSAQTTDNFGLTATTGTSWIVNTRPSVSLSTNAAAYTAPASVIMSASANANDAGDSIARVNYYADAGQGRVLVGASTTGPSFSYGWVALKPGTYAITADAVDQRNGVTTSAPVNIVVNAPVNATITSGFDAILVNGFVTNPTDWAWVFNASSGIQHNSSGMCLVPTPHGQQTAFLRGGTTPGILGQAVKFTAGTYAVNFRAAKNSSNPMALRFKVNGAQVGGDLVINTTNYDAYTTATFTVPADGTHQIELSATSGNNADTVCADIVVIVWAPGVALTSPSAGRIDINGTGATLTLSANAAANGAFNSIAKVQFFNGATQIGTDDTSSPYGLTTPAGPGVYTFTAKATDTAGLSSTSAPVSVTVNRIPSVTLAAAPTNVNPGAQVTLNASASDPDGSIGRLEVFQNAGSLGFVSAGTQTVVWTAPSVSTPTDFAFTAVATDNLGATSTSPSVIVRVSPPNRPPVIDSFSAVCVAPCYAPAKVNFSVAAHDPDTWDTIAMSFLGDGGSIAPNPLGGGNYQIDSVTQGDHRYKVTVTDSQGAGVTSAEVTITVSQNNPPTISSVTPAQAQIALGGSVTYTVVANDPEAHGLTVRLRNGSTPLATGVATGAANTYSITWTPSTAGTYTLQVRATDADGLATDSAALPLTVTGAPASASPNAKSVVPVDYGTPEVGSTPGTFAVADGGAATYTIPIQVPPGTAGMQPQLALTYSSQGGYGMVGTGWSLSGLSAVTRCPKTLAQDGVKATINYDTNPDNDRYCLDGQRLIPVGQSADGGQEFRTELESYSRIVAYSKFPTLMYGPNRFRVWTKEGRILDYGSRWWIMTAGWQQAGWSSGRANVAKVWVLDKVTDRAGNYLTIDYADKFTELGQGSDNVVPAWPDPTGDVADSPSQPIGALPTVEYWPTSVKYYPSTGTSDNEVLFTYESIPASDQQRYYDGGAGSTTLTRRLIGIETRADGARARKYRLRYERGNSGNSRLKELYECGVSDTDCLKNPAAPANAPYTLKFDWSDSNDGFVNAGNWTNGLSFINQPYSSASSGRFVKVGDINGDGRSDLLVFTSIVEGPFDARTWEQRWVACFSTGSGFNCAPENSGFHRKFGPSSDTSAFPSPLNWYLADIDGDGRVDLVLNGYGSLEVCYSRESGWQCVASAIIPPKHGDNPNFQGDIDGDGRIDHLYYQETEPGLQGAQWVVCLSTDAGPNCQEEYLRLPCERPDDPLCEGPTGNTVQYENFAADFNGDGKLDLLQRRASLQNGTFVEGQEQWRLCVSDFGPGGTQEFVCHKGWIYGIGGPVDRTVILDLNGDGLPDMAARRPDSWLDHVTHTTAIVPGTDQTRWQVCLSTGDGAFEFFDPNVTYGPTVDPFTAFRCRLWNGVTRDTAAMHFGDFNGDGRSDLLAEENSQWRVCRSTGTNFSCANWGSAPYTTNLMHSRTVTGDFDGDGRTDVLVSGGTVYTPSGQMGDQLIRITTGFGATTDITYAPLTDSSVYQRGSGANAALGEIDIQSPIYVVKKTEASNGQGGVFTEEHYYQGLRGTTKGRGLMGFETRRSRDDSGVVTEIDYQRVGSSEYASKWPIVGRVREVRKYAPPYLGYRGSLANPAVNDVNLRLVSQSTTTWGSRNSHTCYGNLCSGVYEALSLASAQASWELDGSAMPSTSTSTPLASYDAYGNAQSLTVSTSDGFTKTTANTYQNLTADWLLGRLVAASVTASATGLPSETRTSSFTYQGILGENCGAPAGAVCSETMEPNKESDSSNVWQSTRYAYDGFGNRSSATVRFKTTDGAGAAVAASRASETLYDAYGRYPVALTNSLGHVETRAYDARWGAPTEIVGPNGIRTVFAYDKLGRKYRETTLGGSAQSPVSLAETFSGIYRVSGSACRGRPAVANAVYCKFEEHSGGAASVVQYDTLQRERRVETRAFAANVWASADTSYDTLGRKSTFSKPAGSGTLSTTLSYDLLGRITSEEATASSGATFTNATIYQGLVTTVTQSGTGFTSRSTQKTTNSQGRVISVKDPNNGVTSYAYDAQGNLTRVVGPTGIQETMSYDLRGRKLTLSNPDSGNWSYGYNGAGEMIRQTDAKGQVTTQFHDALGRLVERREYPGNIGTTPFVTVWSYDRYADSSECNQGIGKLCETRSATLSRDATIGGALELVGSVSGTNHSLRQTTQYDAYGRAESQRQELREPGAGGQVLTRAWHSATSYDAQSRPDKLVYPSGYTLANRYTAWSGQLDQVAEWVSGSLGQVHWQASGRNLDGQISGMTLGSGIPLSKTYDGFGRVKSINAASGNLANASFSFDALGNLLSRSDAVNGQAAQSYGYDPLNRLTTQDSATVASYDAAGNLRSKSGVSSAYVYLAGTHKVQSAGGYVLEYDANGNVTRITGNGASKTLNYRQLNLPESIVAEGNTLSYLYDGAHARIKETVSTNQGSSSTYYLGGFELHTRSDGVVEERHYLSTPEGAVGIHTRRSSGVHDTRYWFKDHLGSIVAITDAAGAVKARYAYDAWGKRSTTFGGEGEERGFTGHEHLIEAGLIHMNGRLYFEPLGRMLQADPIIQEPLDGQNYNRYSYVLNNPLAFTDPTGFSTWTRVRAPVVGIIVTILTAGTMTGWSMALMTTNTAMIAGAAGGFAAGGLASGTIEGALKGAVTGAAFGALNFGIGSATGAGSVFGDYGAAANIAMHAVVGCGQAAAAGGSCGGGALAGGFSAAAGFVIGERGGVIGRAVIGAAASKLGGGRAGDGAMVAVFDYLFNQAPHVARTLLMRLASEEAFIAAEGRSATAIDLGAIEGVSGAHVIRNHVGYSAEELAKRLAAEPRIPAAASFTSRLVAENAIGHVIDTNGVLIQSWVRGGMQGTLSISRTFSEPVGIVLVRGAQSATPAYTAEVVLARNLGPSALGFPPRPYIPLTAKLW